MSLNDRQHVEAVAIIRALVGDETTYPSEAVLAGRMWLAENHPAPEVYMSAMKAASGRGSEET